MNRHNLFKVALSQVWLYINVRGSESGGGFLTQGFDSWLQQMSYRNHSFAKLVIFRFKWARWPGSLSLCGWLCWDQHHHKSTVSHKQPLFIRNHINVCKWKPLFVIIAQILVMVNDCEWFFSFAHWRTDNKKNLNQNKHWNWFITKVR